MIIIAYNIITFGNFFGVFVAVKYVFRTRYTSQNN